MQVLLLLLVLKQSVDGICQTNLTNITVQQNNDGSMMTHRNDLICLSYTDLTANIRKGGPFSVGFGLCWHTQNNNV